MSWNNFINTTQCPKCSPVLYTLPYNHTVYIVKIKNYIHINVILYKILLCSNIYHSNLQKEVIYKSCLFDTSLYNLNTDLFKDPKTMLKIDNIKYNWKQKQSVSFLNKTKSDWNKFAIIYAANQAYIPCIYEQYLTQNYFQSFI